MFCLHRKLAWLAYEFTDVVSGKKVFSGYCKCGDKWLTDSRNKWFGSRVRSSNTIDINDAIKKAGE